MAPWGAGRIVRAGSPGGATRASWIGTVVLVALVGCAPQHGSAPRYERPPIIIINIDTLRADHLGAYGYSRDTSPNFDILAAEAARFEWAFAQAPSTAPSQASILTGRYPRSHGRVLGVERVDPSVVTLAEALGEAGYRTAAFVDGGLMSAGAGLEQGFEIYDDRAGRLHKIGPRSTAWLDAHLDDAETRRRPFLLMVHTYDVHAPYEQTPARFRQRYLDEVRPKPSTFFRQRPTNKLLRVHTGEAELSAAEIDYTIALYDGGIRHVDEWFGGFRRLLERRGLWRQSVIVLISDHGEAFGEHGRIFHDRLYSPVTRIPLIVKLPDGQHAGRVEETTVESLDLMPTLLELAGVTVPSGVQGESLLSLLAGEPRRSVAVSEASGLPEEMAIVTDQWRLVMDGRSGRQELFHYRDDPKEQRDVSGAEPERTRRLARTLDGWQKRVARLQAGEVEYTEEAVRQLSALGYVDTVRALRARERPGRPAAGGSTIFGDGFESGNVDAWSSAASTDPNAGPRASEESADDAP